MRASPSSSAQEALRTLGQRLHDLRRDAHLTGRDLAQLAGWHSSKVSKIEHGRQAPSPEDIDAWCQHCGALGDLGDLIASLHAVEGMFVEWRRIERHGLLQEQRARTPLWQRTQYFRIYACFVIPGPIQTPEYLRAVLTTLQARRGLPDDVRAAVDARMDRQQVAHDPKRRFAIVVEESVLRGTIGGPDVMAAQLGHLLTIGTLASVSLGIIPTAADRTSAWQIESFWIFDDEQVSVELVSGHLTVTQPREIAMYADTFNRLANLAVYGASARALIADAIAALR